LSPECSYDGNAALAWYGAPRRWTFRVGRTRGCRLDARSRRIRRSLRRRSSRCAAIAGLEPRAIAPARLSTSTGRGTNAHLRFARRAGLTPGRPLGTWSSLLRGLPAGPGLQPPAPQLMRVPCIRRRVRRFGSTAYDQLAALICDLLAFRAIDLLLRPSVDDDVPAVRAHLVRLGCTGRHRALALDAPGIPAKAPRARGGTRKSQKTDDYQRGACVRSGVVLHETRGLRLSASRDKHRPHPGTPLLAKRGMSRHPGPGRRCRSTPRSARMTRSATSRVVFDAGDVLACPRAR
jgi:hypothetical protein